SCRPRCLSFRFECFPGCRRDASPPPAARWPLPRALHSEPLRYPRQHLRSGVGKCGCEKKGPPAQPVKESPGTRRDPPGPDRLPICANPPPTVPRRRSGTLRGDTCGETGKKRAWPSQGPSSAPGGPLAGSARLRRREDSSRRTADQEGLCASNAFFARGSQAAPPSRQVVRSDTEPEPPTRKARRGNPSKPPTSWNRQRPNREKRREKESGISSAAGAGGWRRCQKTHEEERNSPAPARSGSAGPRSPKSATAVPIASPSRDPKIG